MMLSPGAEGVCHDDAHCAQQLECQQGAGFAFCDRDKGQCSCGSEVVDQRLVVKSPACFSDNDCIKLCGDHKVVKCMITYCQCEP